MFPSQSHTSPISAHFHSYSTLAIFSIFSFGLLHSDHSHYFHSDHSHYIHSDHFQYQPDHFNMGYSHLSTFSFLYPTFINTIFTQPSSVLAILIQTLIQSTFYLQTALNNPPQPGRGERALPTGHRAPGALPTRESSHQASGLRRQDQRRLRRVPR